MTIDFPRKGYSSPLGKNEQAYRELRFTGVHKKK